MFLGCLFSVIWVLLDLNLGCLETDLCCYGNLERLLMSVGNKFMFHVIGDSYSYSSKFLSIYLGPLLLGVLVQQMYRKA
jgi:hypothetical protein